MKSEKISTTTDFIFKMDNFIYLSILVMILNSVAWFKMSPFSQLASMLLAAYGVMCAGYSYLNKTWNFKNQFWLISLLLVTSSLLSLISNGMPFLTKNVYSLLSVFINFYIFYLIYQNRKDSNLIQNVMLFIVVTTTIITLINIFFYFTNTSFSLVEYTNIRDSKFIGVDPVRHRFNGLSGNANGLSRVSLSSILSAFLLGKYVKNRTFHTAILPVITILNIFVIFISQSRGTIYSLFIFLILFAVSYFVHSLYNGNKYLKLIIAGVLVLVLSIPSVLYGPTLAGNVVNLTAPKSDGSGIVDRNETDENIENDVSNGRFTLITNGIKATAEKNLLFGLSYSGNAKQVQEYLDTNNIKVPHYIYSGAGSMHNTVVQSFVNNGLFGLIALISLLIGSVYNFIKLNFFTRFPRENNYEISVYNGIIVSLLVLNMVEWIFYFDFDNHLVNFLLLITFGWFAYETKRAEKL